MQAEEKGPGDFTLRCDAAGDSIVTTQYLQTAAAVMGKCLDGPTGGLTINNELDGESLTIFLAVACTTLGHPRTKRIVGDIRFESKNRDLESALNKLEALARADSAEDLQKFLRSLLLAGEHRERVLSAGMDEKTLNYLISDASRLALDYTARSPNKSEMISRLRALTMAVCTEARIRLDRYAQKRRLKMLERSIKVIGGAAARITASKSTGGVSEVLNLLGETAIDRGLEGE